MRTDRRSFRWLLLRDLFALAALIELLAQGAWPMRRRDAQFSLAGEAFAIAEAMLAVRSGATIDHDGWRARDAMVSMRQRLRLRGTPETNGEARRLLRPGAHAVPAAAVPYWQGDDPLALNPDVQELELFASRRPRRQPWAS